MRSSSIACFLLPALAVAQSGVTAPPSLQTGISPSVGGTPKVSWTNTTSIGTTTRAPYGNSTMNHGNKTSSHTASDNPLSTSTSIFIVSPTGSGGLSGGSGSAAKTTGSGKNGAAGKSGNSAAAFVVGLGVLAVGWMI